MPKVHLNTSIGSIPFQYYISTPGCTSASTIDPSLPTVLLLHPIYSFSNSFHAQFSDPHLRAFNLIAMDGRGTADSHPLVGPTFDRREAAEDVYQFMLALDLPPVYIAAVSMGTMAAFELALNHPGRVRGLLLASHLCLPELPSSSEGRAEVYDVWEGGLQNKDIEQLRESIVGAHQLGFNNIYTNYTASLLEIEFEKAVASWSTHRDRSVNQRLMVDQYNDRARYTEEQISVLSRSNIPILLLAGDSDVGYPTTYTEEFSDDLRAAKVDVETFVIQDGPHYLNVSHPKEFTELLTQFIHKNLTSRGIPIPPPPDAAQVVSPFLDDLVKAGLVVGHEYTQVPHPRGEDDL